MPRDIPYKFTTHSPNPTRPGMYDIVGHRMAWIARRNPLAPTGKNMAYQCKCTCKWKDTNSDGTAAWVPKRVLDGRFARHIMEVQEKDKLVHQRSFDEVAKD